LFFFRFFGLTKIYLHEQNLVMGKVNFFFTSVVDKVFLNFPGTIKLQDKHKEKYFLVGLPTNNNFKYRFRNIDLDNKSIKKIFVCGGSQGAVNLNKKIMEILMKMPRDILDKVEVSMQCSNNQFKEMQTLFEKLKINYDIQYFFENFIEKLYQTDILIARSGAGTVNDVIITQIPTIFVPLPSSANQHQTNNANFLFNKKASLLIEEKNLNDNQSLLAIIELINNSNKQIDIIKNLQKIKSLDSNKLIYNIINENK